MPPEFCLCFFEAAYVGILKKKYIPQKKKIKSGDQPASKGGSCPTPPIASSSAEAAQ